MNSPILPAQDPSGPPSTMQSTALEPSAATLHEELDAFIAGLTSTADAHDADAHEIDAARGGPPPDVLRQIEAAAAVCEELGANARQLRFFPGGAGRAPRVELHDLDGELVRSLSVADALDMAAGRLGR